MEMKTNGPVSNILNVGNGTMEISMFFNQDGNLLLNGKLIQNHSWSMLEILKNKNHL